jgi:hypothetical protein
MLPTYLSRILEVSGARQSALTRVLIKQVGKMEGEGTRPFTPGPAFNRSTVRTGGGPWALLMQRAVARCGVLSASFLLATQPDVLLGRRLCASGLGTLIFALLFLRGSAWQRILRVA